MVLKLCTSTHVVTLCNFLHSEICVEIGGVIDTYQYAQFREQETCLREL